MQERKRREVDPTVALLREAVGDAEGEGKDDEYARQQLAKMLEFFETATECYQDVGKLSPSALRKLMKMGGKVGMLLR
jgi:DNA-binding transcriptional regulator GbsR (MarR family)